jgi:hypothetical protein
MPEDEIAAACQHLRDAIDVGDTVEALDILRAWLEYPRVLDPAVEGPIAADMAQQFAVAMGAIAPSASPPWDGASGLFDLGRALLRLDLPAIAATVLVRAHELEAEDREVTIATTFALLALGDASHARAVIEEGDLDRSGDVVASYLTAFSRLATADLSAVRDVLDSVLPATNRSERLLVARMEAMYARARLLASAGRLDEGDLRGWHYVLTAGLLLLRSPHGAHMNGRYGYLIDTPARCRLAIDRAQIVLRELGISVPRVVTPDDTDSLILATAAARLMSVPLATMSSDGHDTPGLFVLYEVAGQPPEVIRRLHAHGTDQALWVHSAGWTREEPLAGDLTTLLAQSSHPEWRNAGVHGRVDMDVWIHRIVDSDVDADTAWDLHDLRQLLDAITGNSTDGDVLPAALRHNGERLRQWAASPVPSVMF